MFAMEDQEGRRAIGDVVQGLHGSKYQFNDAAGITFEGQQFAEMGYSSGDQVHIDNYENEPIPQWALKLKEMTPPIQATGRELVLGDDNKITVEIQNDERSWEMYYAFVIGPSAETIKVQPWVGQLAPRGGANHFSDSAVLDVSSRATDNNVLLGEGNFLIVGTEADKWLYKLISKS